MNHVVAGVVVAIAFLAVVFVWALLGLIVGNEWAVIILLCTLIVGVAAGIIDYVTEGS